MRQQSMFTLPRVLYGSVITAIFCFIAPFLGAQEQTAADADTITRHLRDAVYNHELDTEEFYRLRTDVLERIKENLSDPAESTRGRALAHYYIGRWHQAIKTRSEMVAYARELREDNLLKLRKFYIERDQAMEAYVLARSECEQLLELRPDDAESYRLYGEVLGQILFLGDVGDALSIGGKAKKNVRKALELDAHLVKAMIQEASRLAYTPLSWGGNPDEAREALRAIMREGVSDTEDLFNIYGCFAMAAFTEQDDSEALSWFNEALGVYPGNVFASGMADFLKETAE